MEFFAPLQIGAHGEAWWSLQSPRIFIIMDLVRHFLRPNYLSSLLNLSISRQISTSSTLCANKDRARDRRDLLRGLPVRSEGDDGGKSEILVTKER